MRGIKFRYCRFGMAVEWIQPRDTHTEKTMRVDHLQHGHLFAFQADL